MAAVDADRNLLFGLLALQNGLIDQDQLVRAFRAWSRDKGRPIAGYLVDRGDMDGEQCRVVEAMVGLHERKHGGRVGKSLTAIPIGPSTRESLASLGDSEIQKSLNHVGSELASSPSDADAGRTATYSVGSATSNGQRFQVLRPHARGGLGAVFVALDSELHREVALKQILDFHADDPVSRHRFLLEAEITGGLEHPGIVPVYGLGTHADGRPYYAMRFIRGDSLKEAVDRFHGDATLRGDPGRRSLELRKLLRRFTDVCNAIDYAHSRGVLHRDIKPANIIVGKHGETLIIDWGLAKATGRSDPGAGERTLVPSSSSDTSGTSPGSALGTPAYMSPEQGCGQLERLGPRSDVYSLGATLYCVLTGKPPQEGDDIGELLRRSQRGEFPRPGQHDPSIDQGLEAVCLKAMAIQPAGRYPTARELADDLDRWMADEPVTAWREPTARRARRWARRNRTAMATAAVAMMAVVAGLAVVLAVQTRAKADIARALGREAAANDELSRSRKAVQARYELAVEAIKTFHTGVSRDFLLKEEKFKGLRDRLLRSAADFYGKLGALLGRETDVASRRVLASSNFELAELTDKVGHQMEALEAHRSVLAAREALASEPGAGVAAKVDVGRSLTAVADLLEETGKTSDALAACRRSEALLAGLVGFEPSAREPLAACRSRLGYILSRMGRGDEALAVYRQVRADYQALAAAPGASAAARHDLAAAGIRLALHLEEMHKPAEAEAQCRKGLALLQDLADEDHVSRDFRDGLAYGRELLGMMLWERGRNAEGVLEYRRALTLRQKLVDDEPAVAKFRSELALHHNGLGIALAATGKSSDAEAEYRAALALLQNLADDNPAVVQYGHSLAQIHNNLGYLLSQTGRRAEAESEVRAALAIRQKLADEDPAVPDLRIRLAASHHDLANLLSTTDRTGEAEAEYRAVIGLWQELLGRGIAPDRARGPLAICHYMVGTLRERDGDRTGAIASHREAVRLDGDRPGMAIFTLGRLLREAGRHDEAISLYRRAIAIDPGNARGRMGLAVGLTRVGRPAEAIEFGRDAIRLLDGRIAAEPGKVELREDQARALITLGDACRATGSAGEARVAYERAVAIGESLVRDHPPDAPYRGLLASGLLRHARARRDLGDPNGAAVDARRASVMLGGLASRSGAEWFETACCRGTLAGLAARAGSGSSSEEAAVEADAVMALLHKAAATGYRDLDAYRTDEALSPLRGREDFQSLMMDLAFPAKPFAR